HQCRRAENHRGEPAPGRLAYQRSLGKAAAIAAGLAALYSIFLPVLWVVLLHHVAADLSAGGAASEHRQRRPAVDASSVPGRMRIVRLRDVLSNPQSLDRRRRQGPPPDRVYRVHGRDRFPAALEPTRRRDYGDDHHGYRQLLE